MRKSTLALALAMSLMCTLAPVISAAENSKDLKEETTTSYSFEPVIVTTRKESEQAQDVAASIDVMDGIEVEEAGVESIKDVLLFMPNVFGQDNYGINKIIIRGVGAPDTLLFSPSAFYVDDVPYIIPEMRNPDLFDVDSIEVLRGPQGSLYGSNAETGVINIVSRKPSETFGGSITGSYGNYNTFMLKGDVSAPIIEDKLFFNMAVSGKSSDGYITNEYDDSDAGGMDHKNIRSRLSLKNLNGLDADFTANAFDYDDQDGSFRLDSGPDQTTRHNIDWDGPNKNDRHGDNQALRLNYEGSGVKITSVTTRNYFYHLYNGDADLTPIPTMEMWSNKKLTGYTQELRFASPKDNGPWKWLAGIYGSRSFTDCDFKKDISLPPVTMNDQRTTDITSDNAAAFGQATYTFLDALHLTGGFRIDYTRLHGVQDYEMYMNGGLFKQYHFDKTLYNTEFLPKISISYDITESAMLYGTAGKGYLAGGFNSAYGDTPEQFIYEPERMWSYEAGIKTNWFDNTLVVNAALFWLQIDDKQVRESAGTSMWIANADKAESKGFEITTRYRPIQGLDLFASLGYQDTSFKKWIAPDGTGTYDYRGKTLPYAPKYTYNAGIQYRHETGFFGRIDMLGKTAFYTDSKNEYECGGNQIYNLRIGYETENWKVSLWSKNLFDSKYITDRRYWPDMVSGSPHEGVVDGAPRTYGIEATWSF